MNLTGLSSKRTTKTLKIKYRWYYANHNIALYPLVYHYAVPTHKVWLSKIYKNIHPTACDRVYCCSSKHVVDLWRDAQRPRWYYLFDAWTCICQLAKLLNFIVFNCLSIPMTHVNNYSLLRELQQAGLIQFNPATLKLVRSITGKLFMNYTVQ